MIRLSSDLGAPRYTVYVTPRNGVVVPSRTGTTFYYRSAVTRWGQLDADADTRLHGLAAEPERSVLAALAVTSHNTGQLSTAVFNTVSVSP